MSNSEELTLECRTCVAANTTACTDCVVSHLLANDAGPIDFVTVDKVEIRRSPEDDLTFAVGLFTAAGLVAGEPEWVDAAEFDAGGVPQLAS